MLFGGWLMWVQKTITLTVTLDGVTIGRIYSEPRVVTSRRCGLLLNYFGHLFFIVTLLINAYVSCFFPTTITLRQTHERSERRTCPRWGQNVLWGGGLLPRVMWHHVERGSASLQWESVAMPGTKPVVRGQEGEVSLKLKAII